jgi:hypothetical protein
MPDSSKLRELASWYREFAECTANPMIWEARLHTAEDLEAEADRLDRSGNPLVDRYAATSTLDQRSGPASGRLVVQLRYPRL